MGGGGGGGGARGRANGGQAAVYTCEKGRGAVLAVLSWVVGRLCQFPASSREDSSRHSTGLEPNSIYLNNLADSCPMFTLVTPLPCTPAQAARSALFSLRASWWLILVSMSYINRKALWACARCISRTL